MITIDCVSIHQEASYFTIISKDMYDFPRKGDYLLDQKTDHAYLIQDYIEDDNVQGLRGRLLIPSSHFEYIPVKNTWIHVPASKVNTEFIKLYTGHPFTTVDSTHMPRSLGPNDHGKVCTTVTRDTDDPRKILSLHSKFLPPMNYYNTAVLRNNSEIKNTAQTHKDIEVVPFQVRLGKSSDNVKAALLRLIPEDEDIDDLHILIDPIF